MASVETVKKPDVKIILSNNEATWLMGFIQNYPGDISEEPIEHGKYRRELFDALKYELL